MTEEGSHDAVPGTPGEASARVQEANTSHVQSINLQAWDNEVLMPSETDRSNILRPDFNSGTYSSAILVEGF